MQEVIFPLLCKFLLQEMITKKIVIFPSNGSSDVKCK